MRSIWNGSISFGLVTIPIKMYSASEDRKLDLDMLDRHDHARIRYKRVNERTGKEVEWKDIVKGYKIEDNYVILDDEDFDKANMKKSRTLEIEAFIKEEEVAEVLYKKPSPGLKPIGRQAFRLDPTRCNSGGVTGNMRDARFWKIPTL